MSAASTLKIELIDHNIAGPDYPWDPDELTFTGCGCGVLSCGDLCPCISRFGANYSEDGRILKLDIESGINCGEEPTPPVVECNAMCECGEQCRNRVIQNGPTHKLEAFTTERKGSGLRTLEDIPRHSFVCEYAGELLTRAEAQRRLGNLKDKDHNYILVVREFSSDQDVTETIVDPTYKGNIGRFINHSCEPNLFKVPVRIHNEIPKVALFARRDVASGEELTYSYGEETSVRMGLGPHKRKQCYCGSETCAGYLPSDQSLLQGSE